MGFNIYFDESHKIDKYTSNYAYYGILGIDDINVTELYKIAKDNNIKQELHFTKFNLDKIDKYICLLKYALKNGSINIYVVNTDYAFKMADKVGYSEEFLRKGFYIKIPERLIYGMTRNMINEDDIKIFIDKSSDYGCESDCEIDSIDISKIINTSKDEDELKVRLSRDIQKAFNNVNICKTIKEQLNAQSLYRGLKYNVKNVNQKNSIDDKCLQIIDVILGSVVFLIEDRYYEIKDEITKEEMELSLLKAELSEEEKSFLFKCFKFNYETSRYICIIKQEELIERQKLRQINKKLKLYSQNSIQKAELLYYLLSNDEYLKKFNEFNIFIWGSEDIRDEYTEDIKEINRFNLSKHIARFLNFKYQFDNDIKNKIINIYLTQGRELNFKEREYKDKLGYGSKMKMFIRRLLSELKI